MPVFANFFIDKYSKQFAIPCKPIEPNSLIKMLNYSWQGNICELENIIQKEVLLTKGEYIRVDIPEIDPPVQRSNANHDATPKNTVQRNNLSVRNFLNNKEILTLAKMEMQYTDSAAAMRWKGIRKRWCC